MGLLDFTTHTSTPDPPFAVRASRWATSLEFDDVPTAVRRAARAQRASTLGAAVWSTTHPLGQQIAETVVEEAASGRATLLGGASLGPADAAAGNAALSMAQDFDGTILGGHTGHSTVWTALADAEAAGASPERALLAQVGANELAARVASAAAIGPFRGQQTAYVHAVGAAVARAIVAGDDAETLADAIGLALAQPPWPLDDAFFGSDAKVCLASEPIRTGLRALSAARHGHRGSPTVLEGDGGFLDAFATVSLPEFLGDLGARWHTRAVTVKAVPGCAYVTGPVEAARRVATHADVDPDAIAEVTVEGSLFATEVNDRATPYLDGADSPLSALTFTIPYNVAVALIDGEHTPRQLRPERVADPAVWSLAERVSVEHGEEFTMAALDSAVPIGAMLRRVGLPVLPYAAKSVGVGTTLRHLPTLCRYVRKRPLPTDLAGAAKRMGARVTVETAEGHAYAAEVAHPTGFAGQPLEDICDVAAAKYRDGLLACGFDREEATRRSRVQISQSASDGADDHTVSLPDLGVA